MTDSPQTEKFTVAQIAAMPEHHIKHTFEGTTLHAIDGTKFDPPMGIEQIGVIDEPEFASKSLVVTVWPANGWMTEIRLTADNGLMDPNTLEFGIMTAQEVPLALSDCFRWPSDPYGKCSGRMISTLGKVECEYHYNTARGYPV